MYDQQIKIATRQANTTLIVAFILVFVLGILTGVLYSQSIINFINSIIK